MIRLNVRVAGNGRRFRDLASYTAPSARRDLSDQLFDVSLQEITATTPVDSGRLKRGWQSAAGGPGGEGLRELSDESGHSRRTATNTVPYVVYLEYGTRRMAPRENVRRALSRVRSLAASLFTLRSSIGFSPSGGAVGVPPSGGASDAANVRPTAGP